MTNKIVSLGPQEVTIPEDWSAKFFDDVADVNPSYNAPENGKHPFLPMDAVDAGTKTIEYWNERDKENCTTTRFKEGDVVYAKITPCTENGKIAYIQDMPGELGYGSTEFIVFSPTHLDPIFLFYLVNWHPFRSMTISAMEGSTGRQRVPLDLFRHNIKIPVPPKDEQEKIGDILSSIDEEIQQTENVVDAAKELKRGLMQDLLTKGVGNEDFKEVRLGPRKMEIPADWEVTRLQDVSRVKRGASPRPIGDDKYFGGDVGWVRISDVSSAGKHLCETEDYLSEEGEAESVRVYPGEVILSIAATVGKPCILDMDACIHDGIVAFKELDERVDEEFLYYTMLWERNRLISKGQTGTQANINSTIVGRFRILLPPLEEQKEIAEILSAVDEKIRREKEYKEKLKELKRGLMQDLLTGQVRVTPLLEDDR